MIGQARERGIITPIHVNGRGGDPRGEWLGRQGRMRERSLRPRRARHEVGRRLHGLG